MPVFCTHCGRPLADGEVCSCTQPPTTFCVNCGRPLRAGEVCSCRQQSAPSSFCTKCGRPLAAGERCSCSSGNPVAGVSVDGVKDKINDKVSKSEILNGSLYERGKKIIPDNIRENDGEIPIKQYDVAVLRSRSKFMRSEGRMQVTNKRLLFRATGRSLRGKTVLQHEFAIDELAGLEIKKDYRFSMIDLILMMLFIIPPVIFISLYLLTLLFKSTWVLALLYALGFAGGAGYVAVKYWKKHFVNNVLLTGAASALFMFGNVIKMMRQEFFGWVFMILGILVFILALAALYLLCYKPNLKIDIKTKGGMAPVSIKRVQRRLFSFLSAEDSGFNEVLPAKDTDLAITEIGAMINDIQKLGDFGIKKWKE